MVALVSLAACDKAKPAAKEGEKHEHKAGEKHSDNEKSGARRPTAAPGSSS